MKKLIEYIRLRNKGFTFLQAIKYNYARISMFDALVPWTIFAWFMYFSLQLHQLKIDSNKAHITIVMAETKHALSTTEAKAQKLENILINCLNGDSILVNNRNMDCQIKNYKEAVM